MTEPATTAVPARATKAKLLSAAKTVFAAKGYHGARVSDIVKHAGFAQGTFYLHFSSKKDVFRQLVETFYEGVFGQALRASSFSELDTREEATNAIHTVWLVALRGYRDDRDLARVILGEAQGLNPDVSEVIQQYYRRTVDALVACVSDTQLRSITNDLDLELIGWAVVGMFERVAHQKIVIEGRDDIEYLADQLFQFELYGLLRTL